MSVDIATYVHDLAVAAKAASASLATASDEQRQEAVRAMAAALRDGVDSIVAANELDMSAARDAGTSAGLLDRLLLTPERVEGMAAGLEKLAELPNPVGRVLDHRVLASGVDLTRVSVPLGLVAMVYEARPNVTADAAGICIRTGNACILRGGYLGKGGVIVAKAAKPAQDQRFDIPGFGTKTLESMIYAGATGIIIEAGNTLITEREKTIALADEHNITIVVK